MISPESISAEIRKLLLLLFSIAVFLLSLSRLDHRPNNPPSPEMEVILPRLVQVILAGGDRYLAANLGSIRALVADTRRMDRDAFRVLARVQEDVAWLNPANVDNYYIGAAILPWNGQLEASQTILRQAADARPFDMWPSFYYAFHLYHFERNPLKAAEWLRFAATRTSDEQEQLVLNNLASRWIRKGADRKTAIGLLTAMANTARSSGFSAHLRKHVRRLENMVIIEDAAAKYQDRFGRQPDSLERLEVGGFLVGGPPVDPFGGVYVLDAHGVASVQESR